MFYKNQTEEERRKYESLLKISGSLSRLFSDSKTPYLYYRLAEKVFCQAFGAEDLSRGDVSFDAKKEELGIGLKTFSVGNNNTFQKVAEFNAERPNYSSLQPLELVKYVSTLRNNRIRFTKNAYDLKQSTYHCVLRSEEGFGIFEEEMKEINTNNISLLEEKPTSLIFSDGNFDYSFSLSKSTLLKRFSTDSIEHFFEVEILKDPLAELEVLLTKEEVIFGHPNVFMGTVYLPLYSTRDGEVPEKSGLNQWNAAGRKRNHNEVYIPIPAEVHQNYETFFPSQDEEFKVILPNGKQLVAKVCQENRKALMSNPNKDLGEWILRHVFELKEGELLTKEKMVQVGVDSVRVDKISESSFQINFAKLGSYEEFRSTFSR